MYVGSHAKFRLHFGNSKASEELKQETQKDEKSLEVDNHCCSVTTVVDVVNLFSVVKLHQNKALWLAVPITYVRLLLIN